MIYKLSEMDLPRIVLIEESAHITPWTEDIFQRCLEAGYRFLGIDQEQNLVGFVIYSLQVGECHILNLCVEVPYQGKGLGEALLQQALKQAKEEGASIAFLEVRRSNARALTLYKKLGFIQVGSRKGYYPKESGREDALIFAKDLGVA